MYDFDIGEKPSKFKIKDHCVIYKAVFQVLLSDISIRLHVKNLEWGRTAVKPLTLPVKLLLLTGDVSGCNYIVFDKVLT